MLRIKNHQCSCGLKFKIHSAYQLCPNCGKGVLYETPAIPRCYVVLKKGIPVAKTFIKKGGVVEDVIVFGRYDHPLTIGFDYLTSGFTALYERGDNPNVSIKFLGQHSKIIALKDIHKDQKIIINVVSDK